MYLSLYSFVMTLIWSSLFALLIGLLRRSNACVRQFGSSFILLLFIGSFARLLLPVEFPYTREIGFLGAYATINTFLITPLAADITPLMIFTAIWIAGIIAKTAITVFENRRYYRFYHHEPVTDRADVLRVCCEVFGKDFSHIKVIVDEEVPSPLLIGFIRGTVVLPKVDYTQRELEYIIRHEYTHYRHKDNIVKLLAAILGIFFWWNPFIHIMKKDLAQTLEIRCDAVAIRDYSEEEKDAYLGAMIKTIKSSLHRKQSPALITNEFAYDKRNRIRQRFIIVKERESRRAKYINLITMILMIVFLFTSYLFVFQPRYIPTSEDMGLNENTYEITPENSFILKKADGTYIVVDVNGNESVISEDGAKMCINELGFILREEVTE